MIVDRKVSFTEKMTLIYKVFSRISIKKEDYKDGREFFGFLKTELDNKEE